LTVSFVVREKRFVQFEPAKLGSTESKSLEHKAAGHMRGRNCNRALSMERGIRQENKFEKAKGMQCDSEHR
jgi:hypothetical protein